MEFRKNREVVLTAVKKYGWALQYTSPHFVDDNEVVLAALSSYNPMSYIENDIDEESAIRASISRRLREDPEVSRLLLSEEIKKYEEIASKFFNWGEIKEFNKKGEREWQRDYGLLNKTYQERWGRDQTLWQQNRKNSSI